MRARRKAGRRAVDYLLHIVEVARRDAEVRDTKTEVSPHSLLIHPKMYDLPSHSPVPSPSTTHPSPRSPKPHQHQRLAKLLFRINNGDIPIVIRPQCPGSPNLDTLLPAFDMGDFTGGDDLHIPSHLDFVFPCCVERGWGRRTFFGWRLGGVRTYSNYSWRSI